MSGGVALKQPYSQLSNNLSVSVSVVVRREQFYVDILRRRVSAQSDFYRRLATARDDLKESMVFEWTMLLSSLFQV